MRLVLLGPPGAGKGTLANRVREKFEVLHISTGDILRKEMKSGSELGQEAKGYVESGGLVPDQLVTRLIESRLSRPETVRQGFLLDGFPRTTAQAQDLDKILEKYAIPLEFAVLMEAGLPVILQRLTGRRVCRNCGALYHIKNMPPHQEGICDRCGGELYQRPDDTEATITKRLEVYQEKTAPIIDYYRKQGKLKTIDAEQETAALMKDLEAFVKEFDDASHQNQNTPGN